MSEKWENWVPIEGLPECYIVESIIDSMEGFTILLSDYEDENKQVKINFGDSVEAYRSTNESYRLKLFNELSETDELDNKKHGALLKVIDSDYVNWLSEQSYEWFDSDRAIHFMILGVEFVVDIIACEEPVVSLSK